MGRIATFEWRSPAPTSVDETLVVYDDGSVTYVVRRPRHVTAMIGSYESRPPAGDLSPLSAAGPGPVTFELLAQPSDDAAEALRAVAERVAAASIATPRAAVTFHARAAGPAVGGTLAASLLAVGSGTQAVEFELDPSSSSVHFQGEDGLPMSWQDLPTPPMGFIAADATWLGGIAQAASIPPSVLGAIAFEVPSPAGATGIAILVAGWLRDALPDDDTPERFEVRTATAPIPG